MRILAQLIQSFGSLRICLFFDCVCLFQLCFLFYPLPWCNCCIQVTMQFNFRRYTNNKNDLTCSLTVPLAELVLSSDAMHYYPHIGNMYVLFCMYIYVLWCFPFLFNFGLINLEKNCSYSNLWMDPTCQLYSTPVFQPQSQHS